MGVGKFRLSERGEPERPVAVRRRWELAGGGKVEIADLGGALLIVPAGRSGMKVLLRQAIETAGGYPALVAVVGEGEPDLA